MDTQLTHEQRRSSSPTCTVHRAGSFFAFLRPRISACTARPNVKSNSRRLFRLCSHTDLVPGISDSVRDAADFVELCRIWGYEAEEHIVQTKDGYLLGLHRLQWRRGEEGRRVNSGGPNSIRKRVVYLHHGLLMNSEVWVCQTDEKRCLAFELVQQGFDVWVRPALCTYHELTNSN